VPERTVNEDLLDRFQSGGVPVWRIYEPDETFAVLGAGGDPARDLFLKGLQERGIPWKRRKGGGGAVVLSPGQVVIALATGVESPFRNREYAAAVNALIVEALSRLGVGPVQSRGISDLAIRERKILGTSIYRRKLILFYQASLLVSNDLSLFEALLAPPVRAPDYRGGRRHAEFCTTLRQEGFPVKTAEIVTEIEKTVASGIGGLR
jgi:lipoate---protein ligase